MIKALLFNAAPAKSGLVIGLSRGNCERLLAGQPIEFQGAVLCAGLAADDVPRLDTITVFIVGGETEETIQAELFESMRDRKDADNG